MWEGACHGRGQVKTRTLERACVVCIYTNNAQCASEEKGFSTFSRPWIVTRCMLQSKSSSACVKEPEISTSLRSFITFLRFHVTSLHWTAHLLDILIFRCKIFRHHWHHSAQPRLSKTCLPCLVDPHHPSPIRPTARCTDPPKNWQQETHKQRDKTYAYIELLRHMLWECCEISR